MSNYVQYDSLEAVHLYQEFYSIPNNPISFNTPPGMIITAAMMHTLICAAYYHQGKCILLQ